MLIREMFFFNIQIRNCYIPTTRQSVCITLTIETGRIWVIPISIKRLFFIQIFAILFCNTIAYNDCLYIVAVTEVVRLLEQVDDVNHN